MREADNSEIKVAHVNELYIFFLAFFYPGEH